jgi:hypothetical protein
MVECKHNAKLRKEGLCKECAEKKPYHQFRFCKKACLACNECGYFYGSGAKEELQGKPVIFGFPVEKKPMNLYTAESVRQSLQPKWDTYYAALAVGQSPTWICDQRTKELWCLARWLMDELKALGCPEEDSKAQQRFFNRKSRATDELYGLAAITINGFLTGNIDKYKGRG